MKKIGFFSLAAVLLGGAVFPVFAFAQYYQDYATTPYYYDRGYDRGGDVECNPENQVVSVGTRAYFVADGGDGDYRWEVDGHRYSNRDRFFSYVFYDTGTERVDVTSDGEESSCYVRIVGPGYAQPPYPSYQPPQPVTLVTNYVPTLPNTGFDPHTVPMMVFAVVLLAGSAIIAYPYARKAFAAIR